MDGCWLRFQSILSRLSSCPLMLRISWRVVDIDKNGVLLLGIRPCVGKYCSRHRQAANYRCHDAGMTNTSARESRWHRIDGLEQSINSGVAMTRRNRLLDAIISIIDAPWRRWRHGTHRYCAYVDSQLHGGSARRYLGAARGNRIKISSNRRGGTGRTPLFR